MGLEKMNIDGLRAEWKERFMTAPPKLRSRDLLAREIIYREQVSRDGGLSRSLEKKLAQLAERFAEDHAFDPAPATPKVKPGSCFVKNWKGQRHEVWVTGQGYTYRGQGFRSLSQVALAITGTKWNGPRFFGQRKTVQR